MLYRWLLALKKPSNRLWVEPALGAVLATLFAFAARLLNIWLPPDTLPEIELGTLESLLEVISSSMLAVSTFSLSIMVSAFASAASSATPRATELVMGDDTTRTAIASFISAFIYAIIAKTALGMEFYGQNGRFVLFVSTALVLAYLIVTLIRWVHTLSQLGRMGNTLDKIHTAASAAVRAYRARPNMGAAWQGKPHADDAVLYARGNGYLAHIDMAGLQKRAEEGKGYIHIQVRPGELIMPDTPLATVSGGDINTDTLRGCFMLDVGRDYAQDPSWGFVVLSEAAQRALSAAVNDPGTAINVMTRMMRLLLDHPKAEQKDGPVYDRLSIVRLDEGEWIRDGFAPIARDGAGVAEVGLVMQKVLAGIRRGAPEPAVAAAAETMAQQALARAEQVLDFDGDKQALREKHRRLFIDTL